MDDERDPHLAALFDRAPLQAADDGEAFARAVERRIARDIWRRGLIIVLLTLAGIGAAVGLSGDPSQLWSALTEDADYWTDQGAGAVSAYVAATGPVWAWLTVAAVAIVAAFIVSPLMEET